MPTINDRIKKTDGKLLQLERQKIIQENREKEETRKMNLRRQIIVGEIFIKYFPVLMKLTPQKTAVENSVEFAPLENFKFQSEITPGL